jgi:hypothetical protein
MEVSDAEPSFSHFYQYPNREEQANGRILTDGEIRQNAIILRNEAN